MMTERRWVVSVFVNGREFIRRAVWAEQPPLEDDVFTDQEMTLISDALKNAVVTIGVEESKPG